MYRSVAVTLATTTSITTTAMVSCLLFVYAEIGDVTYHVDDRDVTALTTSTVAAAAANDNDDDDDDDDVDELSSSDVSSYADIKLNNNLMSSTDDNLASYRSAQTHTDRQTDRERD